MTEPEYIILKSKFKELAKLHGRIEARKKVIANYTRVENGNPDRREWAKAKVLQHSQALSELNRRFERFKF